MNHSDRTLPLVEFLDSGGDPRAALGYRWEDLVVGAPYTIDRWDDLIDAAESAFYLADEPALRAVWVERAAAETPPVVIDDEDAVQATHYTWIADCFRDPSLIWRLVPFLLPEEQDAFTERLGER